MNRKGFTLVELLISISIFTVIITIVSSLFVTSFRLRQEVAIREQLYADARFLLERLAREIRGSTLDYEEYFNMNVMAAAGGAGGAACAGGAAGGGAAGGCYGANYGQYVTQFIHPGSDGLYGSTCNRAAAGGSCDVNSGAGCAVWTPGVRCTLLQTTIDTHTGQNPYRGSDAATGPSGAANIVLANAFCGFPGDLASPGTSTTEEGLCSTPSSDLYSQNELYLISPDGFEKTLFRRRTDAENQLLTMVKMRGSDTDNDGVADTFACTEDYECAPSSPASGSASPPEANDFVAVSPNRLNISAITFYISPLESPFHGFSEADAAYSHLPLVTIALTVSPNIAVAGVHAGDFELTLQETVTTELRFPAPAPILGQFDRP